MADYSKKEKKSNSVTGSEELEENSWRLTKNIVYFLLAL